MKTNHIFELIIFFLVTCSMTIRAQSKLPSKVIIKPKTDVQTVPQTKTKTKPQTEVIIKPKMSPLPQPPISHTTTEANISLAQSYIKAGNLHFESDEYTKAVVDYTEAIRLTPTNAEAFNGRGLAYIALGNTEKAEADFSYAIKLNPKLAEASTPTFTFKECYSSYDIPPEHFLTGSTLGKIDSQLWQALDRRGFTDRSYFSVKDGFALVTQMEQYNSDGTSKTDETRWQEYPSRNNFKGIMDYITSVLIPNKGYFRLLVFVVTDTPITPNNGHVSKSEAAAWSSQGSSRLPKTIANLVFTEGYVVSALVYEFEVPESNRVAKQVCPKPRFDARKHLMKIGIKFKD